MPDYGHHHGGKDRATVGIISLKGQCHKIFCIRVFHVLSDPKPLKLYPQVKMHHRYQRLRLQICHRCQRHWQQICRPTVANFAIGTSGVVDTSGKFATSVRVLAKERDGWLRRRISG
jgi:hypothetical protein